MTEDEMVGWHHQLSGHGFGETLESLLDHKAMKPINPKGIFTGRTDADIRSNTLAT